MMRMHSRRFTRLTNALENHAHAFALGAMYCNVVRIRQTLRVAPAMAAKVTTRHWEASDIATVIEACERSQVKAPA